jgi:hypothetical protein
MDEQIKKLDEKWKTDSDEAIESLRKWGRKVRREIKLSMDLILNAYFFPKEKDVKTKGDKAWHVFKVLLVDVIILRIFDII